MTKTDEWKTKSVTIGVLVVICLITVSTFFTRFENSLLRKTIPTPIPEAQPQSNGGEVSKMLDLEAQLKELKKKYEELAQNKEKPRINKTDPCILDPLDDSCSEALNAFPSTALTIDTARICDAKLTVLLPKNDEWICAEDPTCRKCRLKKIRDTQQLYNEFNNETRLHRRLDFANKYFPKERPVIVCSVNAGQVYLFLNFACSCVANNVFDPREYVYMVPTDKKAYDTLKKYGFHVEPLDWLAKSPRIRSEYAGGANVGGHALINTVLAMTSNFFIQQGYHVLIMDVDLVFLRDPFVYLMKSIERRDVLGMFEPRNDQYGFMNSGFIFVRPSQKGKILMQSFENLSFIKDTSDQQLWNTLLRHKEMNQIEQRVLPRHLFFTLWKSTTKYGYSPDVTNVIHAVSVDKANRFVSMNQWYFTEKSNCPYYNKEIDEAAIALNLYGEMP